MRPGPWPALAAATARNEAARVPFTIDGRPVGSVARAHLPALRAWPRWIERDELGVSLRAEDRDQAFAEMNAALREQGLIVAWRDETFVLPDPESGAELARIERASARFWGTLTFGAHANGYVADADGRPTQLWIARRSRHKATDPGKLDNLIGGGVPAGQTPREALVREGWEEAGLAPALLALAVPGRVIRLHRDLREGRQMEDLHAFDLCLPADCVPVNQDGEVEGFEILALARALELAAGEEMTVDAALVTLDFAVRHRLIEPPAGLAALLREP